MTKDKTTYADLRRGDKFCFKDDPIPCMMLSNYYYTELHGPSRGGVVSPCDNDEPVIILERNK